MFHKHIILSGLQSAIKMIHLIILAAVRKGCKKGPGWNDPMTAVVPRVKGFACYDLSFSRHNKNIKMEHFFLCILSRYFI